MPDRKLPSWIDAFLEYTEGLGAPRLFCLWTAIFTVTGALERKVWIRTNKGVLYPNLYILLVGPPGVGKTLATATAYDLMSELDDHHIASSNVSRASLIDDLRDAERKLVKMDQTPSVISFNSLMVMSDELGVLLPSYENDFMNALTNLYDCKVYSERKRTKDLMFKMEAPQLNLLAATTPSYLNNLLPEGAWDQGFLSRTILVYNGESIIQPLWDRVKVNEKLFQQLVADLKVLGEMYGKVSFDEESANAVSEWHVKRGPPAPEHPKLHNYTTRRTAHLLKLCMVAACDRGSFTVNLEDYNRALDWLLQVESFMPDIFKSMNTGGDMKVIEEAWYFAYQIWLKEKKPIAEYRIVTFLQERVPAHNIGRLLEIMVKSKIFTESIEPTVGKSYTPRARKAA